jgi:16S rRNA (guanine1207-N2)-methyltransferase
MSIRCNARWRRNRAARLILPMAASRLNIALAEIGADLSETGEIGVFRAQAGADYSGFPADRLQLFNSFRPEFERLQGSGRDVSPTPKGPFSAVLVHLTRSKTETLGLVATALIETGVGGLVLVDGAKTDGIESIQKRCGNMIPVTGSLAKAHGRIFWMRRPAALPDPIRAWAAELQARRNTDGFLTAPGMFSPEQADKGSRLLAEQFDARLKGRLADLGAGWGWLSAEALKQAGVQSVDLYEAEKTALDMAALNLKGKAAQFFWADVRSLKVGAPYEAVICNPPFHRSRAAEPALGLEFIAKAAEILKPNGSLWLVANRQLPYEAGLELHFKHWKLLAESPGFKAILATKPLGQSARKRRFTAVNSR